MNFATRVPASGTNLIALFCLLALTTACTSPAPAPEKTLAPAGQKPAASLSPARDEFMLKGKTYVLAQDAPGVLEDPGFAGGANPSARRFDFINRIVVRQSFAGRKDKFESLNAAERQELTDVAKGALIFFRRLQKDRPSLPPAYQRDKEIFSAFVSAL